MVIAILPLHFVPTSRSSKGTNISTSTPPPRTYISSVIVQLTTSHSTLSTRPTRIMHRIIWTIGRRRIYGADEMVKVDGDGDVGWKVESAIGISYPTSHYFLL